MQERENLGEQQERILKQLSEALREKEYVLSARVYGSFLTRAALPLLPDLDLAVMIPSNNGVVEHDTYEKLHSLRSSLCDSLQHDIDLIPHTFDEVDEKNSPLWNPRYHPSLHFGTDVKSNFPIPASISYMQNSSVYVLLDNRTITRRQLLRPSSSENWRIFLAKLIHGPGNVLTLLALRNSYPYIANPSDIEESFRIFDQSFGTDSSTIVCRFQHAELLIQQDNFSFQEATWFMRWYEALITTVLKYDQEALKKNLQTLKEKL